MEVRRIGAEDGFVREIKNLRKRVQAQETKASGNIVIRETLQTTDPETGVATIVGQLPDGSYGIQPFVYDITPPPVASTPIVASVPGVISVTWDGQFVNGELAPKDFTRLNIIGHKMDGTATVSSFVVGEILNASNIVYISSDVIPVGETWTFSFEAEDYNTNRAEWSARSLPVTMESVVNDAGVNAALDDIKTDVTTAQTAASTAQTAADTAQQAADDAAASALEASNLAAGKTKTYYQTASPGTTGNSVGDMWVDVDDSYTLYTWSGSAWVKTQDSQEAIDLAATKIRSFVQSTQPTATSVGDIWMNTANKNEMYRWSGSAWVSYRDLSIADADAKAAQAIADAADAQATADGKVSSYFQATQPTGQVAGDVGDLWFDTDDGNKMYRYTGSAWAVSDDQRIASAVTAAANAQTVADSKITTFYQTTQPSSTGRTVGDLWVDTDDQNKLYRWNGASWDSARDLSIASASNAAATAQQAANDAMTVAQMAQATADGSIRTFYQSTAPTGLNNTTNTGDLWFDTDDGQAYRWSGTAWVIIEDNSIAVALAAAQNAQTTADGKITSYYQTGAPAVGEVGDLWFDTDDKNKPYYCSSISPLTWTAVRDGAIADAQATANTALTSANGKNVTYYQTAQPSGGTYITGDTWIDTDAANKMYVYNGTTWVSAQDGAIADANALAASKGKVLIQSTTPVAADQLSQNLWIDTTNGANTPKRWNGSSWAVVTDKAATDAAAAAAAAQTKADQAFNNAAAASTAAGNAQTTADGKNRNWYQDEPPAGTAHRDGDQWFDTNDGNKLYLWKASTTQWVAFQDAAIASAQSTANTALTSANGKNKNYYQTTQPSGGTYLAGDLWFDTDDNYKMYTYSGSAWVVTQDSNTALVTANSKIKTFVQGTAPTATTTGDLWIDTANGNQIKRWSGSAWVDVRDTTIAAAQSTANSALTSADGKNTNYYQTTQPTGGTYKAGDTWFDTDDNYKMYTYTGSIWQLTQDSAGALTDAQKYVQSRGMDLVTNGNGQLLNNKNFSGFTYNQSDAPSGAVGVFDYPLGASSLFNDEAIKVDPAKSYQFRVTAKQKTAGVITSAYTGLSPLDSAGLTILPYHYMEQANTRTTLATTLSPGATTITLTSAANWNNAGGAANTHLRSMIAWNYVDSFGKTWAPGTYSRNWYTDLWNEGAISGNVITLKVPWAGPTIAAGTTVGNGASGSNYMYVGIVNNTLLETWTTYNATVGGVHTDLTLAATTKFPTPTASVKIIFLGNRVVGANPTTGSKHSFGNISFSEVSAANLEAGGITETLIANDAVTTTKINNLAVTDAKISTISAGKITAGFLDAARIAAGSIDAQKMIIGRGSNLYMDEAIADSTFYSTPSYVDLANGRNGRGSILVPTSSTQIGTYYALGNTAADRARRVRVVAGQTYRIGAWVRTSAAAPLSTIAIYLRLYRDSDNANIFSTPSSVTNDGLAGRPGATVANTWVWLSGMVTVPVDTDYTGGVVGFYKQAGYTTGSVRFSDPVVQQAASGELVVDGLITAGSAIISTGAIGTAHIGDAQITTAKITDLAVTDAKINTISAGKITTGFLDAARIDAGTIGAEKLLVSNSTNVLPDPSFSITNVTNARTAISAGGTAGWTVNAGTATGLRYVRRTTASTGDVFHFSTFAAGTGKQAQSIQVEAGQKWLLSVDVETGVSAGVRWNVHQYFADGTWGYVSASPYSTVSGRRVLSYVWTVPAGVIAFYPSLVCNTSGVVFTVYGNAFVGQQAKATLIEDGAITTTHMTAGTIDASVLTAGSITAPKIAAKTITVDKLVVSSTDNLVVEADFGNNGSSWGPLNANKAIVATAGRGSLPALRVTGVTTVQTIDNLVNKVTVGSEDRFRGSFYVKSNAALAAGTVTLGIKAYTTATAFTTITVAQNNLLVANAWTLVEGYSPALPANTIAIEFFLTVTNNATTTITDIDYVAVTRAADGKLIVDGAINGKTITGAKIQTAETGARIVLDSTSLNAWDSGDSNYFSVSNAGGVSIAGKGTNTSRTRTNYAGSDCSFEVGFGNWGTSGTSTLARDTTQAYIGTYSGKLTDTVSRDRSAYVLCNLGNLTPSTFSVYVRHNSASSRNFRIDYTYYDGAYNQIGTTTTGTSVSVPANTWTRLTSTTSTPPSTALRISASVVGIGMLSSESIWFDAVMFENGTTATTFFDANTPASGGYTYQALVTTDLEASAESVSKNVTIKAGSNALWNPSNLTQALPGIGFLLDTPLSQTAGVFSDGNYVSLIEGNNGGAGGARLDVGDQGGQHISLYGWNGVTVTGRSGITLNPQVGSVLINGAVTITGDTSLKHYRAESSCANFSVAANATWDIGPQTFSTSAPGTLNNDFCSPGPFAGSVQFTKSGYYSLTAMAAPTGSPGGTWLRAVRGSDGRNLGQVGNGIAWETTLTLTAFYFAAGDYVRFQYFAQTAHTINSFVTVVKVY